MKNEHGAAGSLSRRSWLGRAVGAAGILSALGPAARQPRKAPPAGGAAGPRQGFLRLRLEVFQGGCARRAAAGFRGRELEGRGSASRFQHRGALQRECAGKGQAAILPTGIGWYRKHFSVPESYRDRKVVIEFEGVYQLSEVWINGQYLGKRPYGYIGFSYDLSPHLKYRRRQRDCGQGGQLPPTQLPLVLGLGDLPAHLAAGYEQVHVGRLGHVRHHAAGGRGLPRSSRSRPGFRMRARATPGAR